MPRPGPPSTPTSRPVLKRAGLLYTHSIQQIFNRYFNEVTRDLLFVSQTLRFLGARGSARATELAEFNTDRADDYLTTALADVRVWQAEADQRLAAAAVTERVTYSQPLAFTTQITSPRAGRLLALMLDADELIQKADTLWLYEHLSDQDRVRMLVKARRRLMTAIIEILVQARQARGLRWFYEQDNPAARTLEHLADGFRNESLTWGVDGWFYMPQIALRFPDALGAAETAAALAEDWRRAGWLSAPSRSVTVMNGQSLVVLNAEVSDAFLVAAGVNRKTARRMGARHRQALTVLADASARVESPVAAPPTPETAVAESAVALAAADADGED